MEVKNIKIKNLTPHAVNLVGEDGKVLITFPSEGLIRLSQKSEVVGYLTQTCPECHGTGENKGDMCSLCKGIGIVKVPISKTSFGEAEGLPPQEEGTIYIVSSLVCQAYPDRDDFFIPDQTVRDKEGRIVGCHSLSQNPFSRKGKREEGK